MGGNDRAVADFLLVRFDVVIDDAEHYRYIVIKRTDRIGDALADPIRGLHQSGFIAEQAEHGDKNRGKEYPFG